MFNISEYLNIYNYKKKLSDQELQKKMNTK